MLRRSFISFGIVIEILIGCRRASSRKVVEPSVAVGFGDEPTLVDPVDRIARAMQRCQPDQGYTFDPITISIIAAVIGQLVRYCLEQRMLKLQQVVKQRPDGAAAVRLRGKLSDALAHHRGRDGVELFAEPDQVRKHADAAIAAFVRATPDEMRTLKSDLVWDQLPQTPRFEAIARELEQLVD